MDCNLSFPISQPAGVGESTWPRWSEHTHIHCGHVPTRPARTCDPTREEMTMSRREELIEKYAADLKDKLGVTPNMDLLKKVTIGCGPAIYNADASTVSGSDPDELKTVKESFLMNR